MGVTLEGLKLQAFAALVPVPRAGRPARAQGRLYDVLRRAADTSAPCPSNRDLCRLAGIGREAKVTDLLTTLRGRRLIEIEWTAPAHGARRITIQATGRVTGWSRSGPETGWWQGPADGLAALEAALGRSAGRFNDVTQHEARRIAADTPADLGLPERPPPASYSGLALAGLWRSAEEDEAEAEEDAFWSEREGA